MSAPQGPVRVMIVDDDPLVRSALVLMLGGRNDIVIVAEAEDGDVALNSIEQAKPDVVLMDVRMPRLNGIDAARRLSERSDAPKILILTTFDTDKNVLDAVAAHVDGFLVKDTPPEELIAAIHKVASGETMLSPSVAGTVVEQLRLAHSGNEANLAAERLTALTERELEVAIAIGCGLSNADIAAELFVSVATVKGHVTHVLEKLTAENRVQIAICVNKAGLN